MKALVTGGGGFLGLYIVEQLLADGFEVRSFSRNSYESLTQLNVEHVAGDLRDESAVERACEGVDVVFHSAAVPGIWGPAKMFFGINTTGTENVIAACRKRGVGKLVYTSSPSVVFGGEDHVNADESLPYPSTWLAHYPASKACSEQKVLAASDESLATCALRPHLIWGPRDTQLVPRLIRRARAGRLRQIGDGSNVISMAYVENVAAAHLQAARALTPNSAVAGQAYFINEPDPVGCWEWINTLLDRAGLPPVRKAISTGSAYRIGAVLECVYAVLRLRGEPPMTRFLASQLSTSHSYDISKARRDFGYEPIVSVEEGLSRLEPELQRIAAE
ncbi:MAG: NAD-dependent epimerase/dehydratase family protein [Planctomycetota bacterium]|nr:NAD-dependent epimerase/dehydratase family protein [Planctomycetota bacterium]MDA1251377.1 NAD-dependent epimerase/dehydratase family protein [Planctomycetota bacterium]